MLNRKLKHNDIISGLCAMLNAARVCFFVGFSITIIVRCAICASPAISHSTTCLHTADILLNLVA